MSSSPEKVKMRDVPPTGVRLAPDLKAQLMREAAINGRTLHAEILHRLQASLQGRASAYSEPASATVHTTLHDVQGPTKSPDELLSELDRAMLGVYRRMPVEKQLALLSLFK